MDKTKSHQFFMVNSKKNNIKMMKNSKLLEMLLSFSNVQFNQFCKFAQIEVKSVTSDIEILTFIKQQLFTINPVGEERIAELIKKKFFENEIGDTEKKHKWENRQWNIVKNRLAKSAENFVAYLKLQEDSRRKNLLLLEYFDEKELDKNYKSLIKTAHKTIHDTSQDLDSQYFQFKLEELETINQYGERKEMKAFANMSKALTNFYVENRLRILVEKINRSHIINTSVPIDDLVVPLKQGKIQVDTFIGKIYYYLYSMLSNRDETIYYNKLKNILLEEKDVLTPHLKKVVAYYLMNQCIYYYRQDRIAFAKDYVDVFKILLKDDLYLSRNEITISKYSNAISMAVISNQLNWASNFILDYSASVQHKNIESVKKLNLGIIELFKGNIEKVWTEIRDCQFLDMYFQAILNKIYIKIYFEKNEVKALSNKLKSFQKFIGRKSEMPNDRKTKHLNFIDIVRTMMKNEETIIERKDYLSLDYLWLVKQKKQ